MFTIQVSYILHPVCFLLLYLPAPEVYEELFDPDAVPPKYEDFTSLEEMEAMVAANMELLNESYNETTFRFNHMNAGDPEILVNEEYSTLALQYAENISATGSRDLAVLDVYLVQAVANEDTIAAEITLAGLALFPSYQFTGKGDGVFVIYPTVTDGGLEKNELGFTLVHEVGHFLGLRHTFNVDPELTDPCSPENVNDLVDDTPTHMSSSDSLDCFDYEDEEDFPDTCPDLEGVDPLNNFMNYLSDEECFLVRPKTPCSLCRFVL